MAATALTQPRSAAAAPAPMHLGCVDRAPGSNLAAIQQVRRGRRPQDLCEQAPQRRLGGRRVALSGKDAVRDAVKCDVGGACARGAARTRSGSGEDGAHVLVAR
eukprot:2584383-Prymnesium_polylepis.2